MNDALSVPLAPPEGTMYLIWTYCGQIWRDGQMSSPQG